MLHLFLIFIIIIIAILIFVSICIYKQQQIRNTEIPTQNSGLQEGLTNKSNDSSTIILIGDSILNNNNYIFTEGKSVSDLIKAEHSDTYLFAKDGAIITDCYTQIEQISKVENEANSEENIYIFVSAGGNNILSSRNKLSNEMIESFFQQYSTLILSIKSSFPNAQIYLLNLYYPLDSRFKNLYTYIDQWNTLLSEFAENNKLKVIQTNKFMLKNSDFTNAIEPSETGGKKLADAILSSVVN
jgi:hypothetical protein